MAVPSDVTMKDMSGKFTLNTTLSDPLDPMLALQGVSWLTRTALAWATVTLTVKHYLGPPATPSDASFAGKPEEVEHIDISQTMSGVPASNEARTLDWTKRQSKNAVFGEVEGMSRRIPDRARISTDLFDGSEEVRQWMAEGWSAAKEDEEAGFVQSYVKSLEDARGRYAIEQVWGMAEINGERRHTRKIRTWTEVDGKVKEETKARLVYDWLGREGEERNAWDDTV